MLSKFLPIYIKKSVLNTVEKRKLSMKNFWLSWWHPSSLSNDNDMGFELYSPWWIFGSRGFTEETDASAICAAVKANSEDEAKEVIFKCYDNRPDELEFRFCEEKPQDWSPYSSRFQSADWMVW